MNPNLRPSIIIEGIDGVGKTLLIREIQKIFGYSTVLKYDKPVSSLRFSQKDYQEYSFILGFKRIAMETERKFPERLIFDRFHLGEYVYAPLYRGYSGDYVFQIEAQMLERYPNLKCGCFMVLLTANNFEILKDDGQSFDRSKVEEEQKMFQKAFDVSWLRKIQVCVHDEEGNWRPIKEIMFDISRASDFLQFESVYSYYQQMDRSESS